MSKSLRVSVVASLLACAAAMPVQAATPLDTKQPRETVTVDFLLEACSVVGETAYGMIPHFDCETYLYGVLDAATADEPKSVCVPKDFAPWQAYELLLAQDVPDARRGEPAAPFVLEKLRAAFPCP